MPTFCLIYNGAEMPRWCELSSTRDGSLSWVDLKGRHIPYEKGRVIGHAYGQTISEALETLPDEIVKIEQDAAYRFLLDPWSDQGWISPEGKFYGCKFFNHDDIAYALIRKSPGSLEYENWVRVHSDTFRFEDLFDRGLTKRQERTLEKLGFIDLYHRSRIPRFEVDRNQPAPRYAVKPPAYIAERPPIEPREPDPGVALEKLIDLMKSLEPLSELFDHSYEVITDVGPGTWNWMIRWDKLDIGSEEDASDLLNAEGLYLRKTSFDTIEIMSWHEKALKLGQPEENLIKIQTASTPALSF